MASCLMAPSHYLNPYSSVWSCSTLLNAIISEMIMISTTKMCFKNCTLNILRPRLCVTLAWWPSLNVLKSQPHFRRTKWVKKIKNIFSLPQLPVSLSFCESRISFSLWMTLALALTTLGVANSVALLWGPVVDRKIKWSGSSQSCTKYCTVKSHQD